MLSGISINGFTLFFLATITLLNGCSDNVAEVSEFPETPEKYEIDGLISNLVGSGLTLRLNEAELLPVNSENFTFTSKFKSGTDYAIAIVTQPTAPNQSCSFVSGESGIIENTPATEVVISCSTNRYTIGGLVTGLNSAGLEISLNDLQPPLAITANSNLPPSFTFDSTLEDHTTYNVAISTQPTNQTCRATTEATDNTSPASGTLAGKNITNVGIHCVDHFTIGGTVTGLVSSETKLVLQNNGQDDLEVTTSNFTFMKAIPNGDIYDVTVLAQPSTPKQNCTVNGDTNKKPVLGENVNTVKIICNTKTYTVGGSVVGQIGGGLILDNNAGQQLTVTGTSFTFIEQADGSPYFVTIINQPVGQNCEVTAAGGTVSGAPIINVKVVCNPSPMNFAASFGFKRINFTWDALPGVSHFHLLEDPDGLSVLKQIPDSGDITSSNYSHMIATHLFNQPDARYRLHAYEMQGTNLVLVNSSAYISIDDFLEKAVGYIKGAPETNEYFGQSISLSDDGRTMVVGAVGSIVATNAFVGKVYIFSRDNNNSLFLEETLVSPSFAANDEFGTSVSISGDGNHLAVGARGIDIATSTGTASSAGAAYVFSRNIDNSWMTIPTTFQAVSPSTNDFFGTSVSLNFDGQILAVGAWGKDIVTTTGTANNAGATYLYSRNTDGSWQTSPTTDIQAQTNLTLVAGDNFGISISLNNAGNTLAVGADRSNNNIGAAYVFTKSIDGIWSVNLQAISPTAGAFDAFGANVSLSDDGRTLAVSAHGATIGTAVAAGLVHVYTQNMGSTWQVSPTQLQSPTPIAKEYFGNSIELSGDGQLLTVGERTDILTSTGTNATDAGSAHIFIKSNVGSWQFASTWSQPYPATNNFFAKSIALSSDGRTLAIAASLDDSAASGINDPRPNIQIDDCDLPQANQTNCAIDSGAVYLY